MTAGYLVIVGLVLFSSVGMLALAYQVWQRRATLGAVTFTLLLCAISFWALINVVESLWLDLPGKVFWARFKYFGILPVSPLTFVFIVQYTRREYWLRLRNILIGAVIPVMMLAVIWTDQWHHLFYTATYVEIVAGHPFLRTEHGVLFWVHAAYSYSLLFLAMILMAVSAYQSARPYRLQHWAVFIATLVPVMANIITVFEKNPIRVLDMTPLAFSISAVAVYLALYKLRLFNVKPIALQTVIENMQDGMLVLDMENQILDINPVLENWLEKTSEQVIGKRIDSIFSDPFATLINENRSAQKSVEIETNTHGQVQVLEARASRILSHLDSPIGRLILLQDVTERKEMEQSLTQASQALADAFELNQQIISSSAIGILAYRENGACVMANEAAARIARTEIDILKKSNAFTSPYWKTFGLLDALEKTIATREPHQSTFRVVHPSGVVVWIDCYFTTFTSQEQLHVLVLFRDVTELKQLEKDLEEAKALLEQAFAQSPVPIVMLSSPGGIIQMLNPAFQSLLKVADPYPLIGTPITQADLGWEVREPNGRVLPPERLPLVMALRGEKVNNVEYKLCFEDGRSSWVIFNATPVLNQSGNQIAVVMVLIDITERRQIEQHEREQRILAETYRDMAATLNSTIQLDAVLTLVLTNIELVVPHDAACVLLLDDEGTVNHSRFRGFIHDERDKVMELCRKVKEMAGWRENAARPMEFLISDVKSDPEWIGRTDFTRLRSFLNVPIIFKDRVTGIITLASTMPSYFSSIHTERLQVFANQAALAIENARLYSEVQNLTLTDELTRVYNYRGLIELGQREFDRAKRFNRSLSVLFFDIDHFREFNNRYSHIVGNQVLQAVAKISRSCLRGVDIIARYGGEEFVILLPETRLEDALQIAERIRLEVEETYVLTRFGRLSVTISIGVAGIADDHPSLMVLIDKANQAEHRAKDEGRNRVCAV